MILNKWNNAFFTFINTDNGPDEGGHPEKLWRACGMFEGFFLKCSVFVLHTTKGLGSSGTCGDLRLSGLPDRPQLLRTLWNVPTASDSELAALSAHCLMFLHTLRSMSPHFIDKEPGAQRGFCFGACHWYVTNLGFTLEMSAEPIPSTHKLHSMCIK